MIETVEIKAYVLVNEDGSQFVSSSPYKQAGYGKWYCLKTTVPLPMNPELIQVEALPND